MTSSAKQAASAQAPRNQGSVGPAHKVNRADLPLSCPPAKSTLWNAHPRVYLAIEKTGQAQCPYCGAEYILQD